MAISAQQQELIDLLRNELAELIGFQEGVFSGGDEADQQSLLEDFEMHAEHIGNAADLVGLEALARCCKISMGNFQQLGAAVSSISREQIALVENWATMLLGYLQYFGTEEREQIAAVSLLDYLSSDQWPSPLSAHDKQDIERLFLSANVQVEDQSAQYPSQVTPEMATLDIASDINPELLRGLITELPQQTSAFERAVEQYLITEDLVQLRIAQRVAHTIKGAANVVGIPGMANLMHYTEDLLEITERVGSVKGLGFLMQDASDCLSEITEFLTGVGSRPNSVPDVLKQLLGTLHDTLPKSSVEEGTVETEDDVFDAVIADHSKNRSVTGSGDTKDGNAASRVGETPAEYHTPSDSIGDTPPDDVPTLTDVAAAKVVELSSNLSLNAPAIKASNDQVLNGSTPATPLRVPPIKDLPATEEPSEGDSVLQISEKQAQELLRLTGESQIGTTQAFSRLDTLASGVRSAVNYHHQLKQLAQDLERLIELQTAMASAARTDHANQEDLDPLEMERYNELNSFASQLREVTTDAEEAIVSLDDEMKSMKNLLINQRQIGFDSQDLLLQVRMLPVNVYISRFQRCVRQAARLTEKTVSLKVSGEDVLADSRVMSSLVDPIMHLLRNAVDHGIEKDVSLRSEKGKPSEGTIYLNFEKQGDTVKIVCRDDGQGLNYDEIERSARAKGLLADGVKLSVSDLNNIILSPGFSTRSQVSQTSGRGVGLDVVNDQVRHLKGALTIESEGGVGTTFTITAPMSILSAHTLVVQCGDHRVSIVSRALEQIIYLEQERLRENNGQLSYTTPDSEEPIAVLPLEKLVFMNELIEPEHYRALIVIRNTAGKRFGVLVQAIRSSEEQIVKPLSRYTAKIPGVVGATILGDGSVSPVIDLHDLPGVQFDVAEDSWRKRFEQRLQHLQKNQVRDRPLILVVDDSLSARRSLAQFVGDMGLDVQTAKDGFEAIQMVEAKKPSMILADLEMPRMNGLELTNHLRANPKTEDIPIIMITSRATEKHRSLAARAGVTSYLNKPWSDEELLTSIQSQIAS